jgi:mannitol-1-/sugar-/sorbitol-6-phosphatase
MPQFDCAAVLFDLDGVLVDSTQSIVVVWSAWARKNGIDPEKVLKIVHGRRTMEVLQILTPHLDLHAEAQQIEGGITHKKDGTVAIPGAAKLLQSLPSNQWCVVTSGIGEFARARLKSANLPIPRVLVSADQVANGKPHPEPYLKGAELLGVEPSKCVVVEDALNGIESGHAGGMKVIGVATTFSQAELNAADAVVKTLEGISASKNGSQLTLDVVW